jgi:putative hemolysin
MHDLLELLVGDLGDKDDLQIEEITEKSEDTWEIMGSTSLDDVEKELGLKIEAEDCDTLGGYIFGLLGTVPDDGNEAFEVETDDLIIRVESVVDHRIEKTTVKKKPKSQDEDEE